MRSFSTHVAALGLALSLLFVANDFAATKYQVTGTVIKLTERIITVQKPNDEKWEIDRDADTKVTGDLKVGAKVTIEYTMTAASVDVKGEK